MRGSSGPERWQDLSSREGRDLTATRAPQVSAGANATVTRCSRGHIKAGANGSRGRSRAQLCSRGFWLCLTPPAWVSGAAAPSSSPCNTPIPHGHILAPLPLPLPLFPFAAAEACMATPTRADRKYLSDSSSTKPNRVLIRGRFLSTLGARLAPTWSAAHKHVAAHGTAPPAVVPATGRGGQGGLTAGAAGCFGKRGAR